MVVDASAIVAILRGEPGADVLARRIEEASVRYSHPVSIYEASAVIAARKGQAVHLGYEAVAEFMQQVEIGLIALGRPETIAALEAFARYGKGRKHPAQLNMGDCFSYACAKLRGMPLLYKGEDFAQTDLAQADLA